MFSYLHIPFCRQKCHYCKFALTPVFDSIKIDLYLAHLKNEIREFFEDKPSILSPLSSERRGVGGEAKKWELESIYFGGGTPSILSVSQISSIINLFRSYIPFSPDIEITLEANPEDIIPEYAHTLKSTGITRISLGVQTLNPTALVEIGRSNPETIFRALDTLLNAGFRNVNTDFIIGLPHVKPGETISDISTLLDRYPLTHTSVYLLEDDQYPKHWKELCINTEMVRSEYLTVRELLISRWFHQYEISNFARPGYESRHNKAYWNHSNTRGFGLSAASYINGRRFVNSSSFSGYYRWEVTDDEILDEKALKIERIMFGMRTDWVDIPDIQNLAKLDEFIADNLLKKQNGKIFPTSAWIFLIDHIIGELI